MLAKISARLTYANVMATVALFVALGGSSYAALTVTGKNIKDRSLTRKDIKKSSLTTTEIKDRSLLSKDFKPGQLPAGAPGPKGDKGDPGTNTVARATCPSGMTLVGSAHDLCFDSSSRGTQKQNWSDAATACALAGLRLPSVSEALLGASTGAQNYWTDDAWNDSNDLVTSPLAWFFSVSELAYTARSTVFSVRCVTTPSNA